MIKAVMFDAGGVLHVANTAVGDDLQQELGLTDEQVIKIFSYYIPLLGTGKLSEQELWKALSKDFGIREVDADEHLFTRRFVNTLEKMPGMYELIDELKAQGIKVLLLTNVSPQFAEVLEQKGHYDPFDLKVLSYEVGSWKPDVEIYNHAIQKLGVKPQEAVFIDDQEKNTVAARKLGIHGIIFSDTEQVKKQLAKLIK
jgi:putative hydrolase of the HAD superfamily